MERWDLAYGRLLKEYLYRLDAEPLAKAREIGEAAMAADAGLLGIIVVHNRAVAELNVPTAAVLKADEPDMDAPTNFLARALSPFEEMYVDAVNLSIHLQEQREAMEKARARAEAAAKLQAEFLANMSHEIRTPLAGVQGMAKLLADSKLDSDQRNLVDSLMASGEHLLSVLNDILDFSKIEAGKMDIHLQSVDLRRCVREALDLLASAAGSKRLEFLSSVDDRIPDTIYGDSVRLKQVILNLVGNAIKFTREGEVELSVHGKPREDGDLEIQFDIRDTGVGMSRAAKATIFRPFSQADTSTTRVHGGTGLGLMISKNLAELMGGRLWLDSEEGKGSTFHFSILSEGTLRDPEEPPESLKNRRMLMVGLQERTAHWFTARARAWGMDTEQCNTVAQARELHQETPFDLLLMEESAWLSGASDGPHKSLPPVLRLAWAQDGGRGNRPIPGVLKTLHKPVHQEIFLESLQQVFGSASNLHEDAFTPEFQKVGSENPLRILVAEDNLVNQMVIRSMLQKMGYDPRIVANGMGVLDAVDEETFDLILMDMHMPGMDGIEAMRKLKALGRDDLPRVVALTANAMDDDRAICLSAGMEEVLTKPVDVELLTKVLLETPRV